MILGVLQWVSGEVWGEGSSSVLHSSALGVRQLLSSALSLPRDTSVFRISPIPEEREDCCMSWFSIKPKY